MPDLDDLAQVCGSFLRSYTQMTQLSQLRDQLEAPRDTDEPPEFNRARITFVTPLDELLSIDVPLDMQLVRMAGPCLGQVLNEQVQVLAEMSNQVYRELQESLACQEQKKNPNAT